MIPAYINLIKGNSMPRARGEFSTGKKPKPKKDPNAIREVPSAEDVIQCFHKFQVVSSPHVGYYTTVTKQGSARLIYPRNNGATVVAIKDKIAGVTGNRVLVRVNLDF